MADRLPRATDATADVVRTVGVVSGGHFLSHLYLLALPPLFPLLAPAFGVDTARLGLSVSLVYLALLLFQVPTGGLVDRIGGERVFVGGLLLTGLGTALVSLATSYVTLLAFAFLTGVGQSAFHPADYALLDAATEHEEGKSFGVHTFAGFVGFAAAPPLVGALALATDWRTALFAVGAVGVLYGGFAHLTLGDVHRRKLSAVSTTTAVEDRSLRSGLALLRHPVVLGMFVFFVVVTVADTGVQTFTTLFVVRSLDYSTTVGNTALTAFFAAVAVAVLVGGVLADRYDSYRILVWSLVCAAAVLWAGLAVGLATWSLLLVWGGAGFCFGLALPARDRVTNALSGAGGTGWSFGVVYTGLPLGGFLAPALLGFVADRAGPTLAFWLVGGFLFAGAVVAALLVWASNERTRTDAETSTVEP